MPPLRIVSANLSVGGVKKVVPYFFWVGILAAIATAGFAETRTISWTAVTTYTDGTLIEAGKTVRYSAYWTTDPGLGSLHSIGNSIATTSATFDPNVQGMARGGTVYFTAKAFLSTGESSTLSPAVTWVVPPGAPVPAAPKNVGITGPIPSGSTALWRLAWAPVTTYSSGAPLEPGRTIRYTAYWTDDPALSAGSLRRLASLISATTVDIDPVALQMPANRPTWLTVQSILDNGDPSSLAVGIKWVAANAGPAPPAAGIIRKKREGQ